MCYLTKSNYISADLILFSLLTDAMEDPITFIKDAGYVSVEDTSAYSYVYDGLMGTLDYIFVNPSLASKLIKAGVWHSNEDEPDVLGELSIMKYKIKLSFSHRYLHSLLTVYQTIILTTVVTLPTLMDNLPLVALIILLCCWA